MNTADGQKEPGSLALARTFSPAAARVGVELICSVGVEGTSRERTIDAVHRKSSGKQQQQSAFLFNPKSRLNASGLLLNKGKLKRESAFSFCLMQYACQATSWQCSGIP